MTQAKIAARGKLTANQKRAMQAVRSIMTRATADPDRTPKPRVKQTCANSRVYLTAANATNSRVECVPSRDESDRAHATFADTGRTGESLLLPAHRVENSRARRYPVSQLTSRGVAFDSAYDEHHERVQRLVRLGLPQKQRTIAEATYEAARGVRIGVELKDIVNRNHEAYEVSGLRTEMRGYLRRGQISKAEYDRVVKG